jgi:hypothetical protein
MCRWVEGGKRTPADERSGGARKAAHGGRKLDSRRGGVTPSGGEGLVSQIVATKSTAHFRFLPLLPFDQGILVDFSEVVGSKVGKAEGPHSPPSPQWGIPPSLRGKGLRGEGIVRGDAFPAAEEMVRCMGQVLR